MLKAKTDPNQCCSETDVEKCTNAELLNPTRRKMYFLQLYITITAWRSTGISIPSAVVVM